MIWKIIRLAINEYVYFSSQHIANQPNIEALVFLADGIRFLQFGGLQICFTWKSDFGKGHSTSFELRN